MIDGRRGLLLATTLLAAGLGGCDWLGWGDSTPVRAQNVRPGMERAVPPSSALPAGGGSQSYDAAIVPVDDRTGQIGSIVAGKGGQKAQQDAIKKEEAERDAKARTERERDRQASTDKAPGTSEPPTEPVAPTRDPVNATPVAPPVGAPTKPTE
jgi:hypothetical protein